MDVQGFADLTDGRFLNISISGPDPTLINRTLFPIGTFFFFLSKIASSFLSPSFKFSNLLTRGKYVTEHFALLDFALKWC